jgi:hypothetical protein
MATTASHQTGDAANAGDGSLRVVDHIKRARRHSRLVRVLKTALPASALIMVGYFAVSVLSSAGINTSLPDLPIPKILPENLAMANPNYSGFGKDGSSYAVKAKSARQNFGGNQLINLDEISGLLTGVDKSVTNFAAVRGDYDQSNGLLTLFEKITVDGTAGLSAEMSQATLNIKESVLTSTKPVRVGFSAGTITANTLTLRHKAHEATFAGDVAAAFTPPKTDAAAAPAADQMFGSSDAPLNITSETLFVKDDKKAAVFAGGVRASQAGQALTSPELTVIYANERDAPATAAAASPAGKIQYIAAKGPVVLERGSDERVTANALAFNAQSNVALLTGDVIMRSGADRSAKAERAELNQATGAIVLSGGAVDVQQGRNELHGRRLAIDRVRGTAQLTSPPAGGAGPGRIRAKFFSADANKASRASADKPQAGASPFASFKSDPSKPIDIEAEILDVNNSAKTAVFRGNVVTVQGDITFKTAEMVAHYTGDVNIADATAPAKQGGQKKSEADLSRIEAKKSVVVTSKDGQSVQGDWATFDAKANTVVVGGEVVLSKGGSMVRGTRMNIDLNTGENKIETAPGATVQQPGGGGWTTTAPDNAETAATANRGRPSAIFFPGDMQGAKNKGAPPPASKNNTSKPSNGDAWSAQTAPAATDPLANPLQQRP